MSDEKSEPAGTDVPTAHGAPGAVAIAMVPNEPGPATIAIARSKPGGVAIAIAKSQPASEPTAPSSPVVRKTARWREWIAFTPTVTNWVGLICALLLLSGELVVALEVRRHANIDLIAWSTLFGILFTIGGTAVIANGVLLGKPEKEKLLNGTESEFREATAGALTNASRVIRLGILLVAMGGVAAAADPISKLI